MIVYIKRKPSAITSATKAKYSDILALPKPKQPCEKAEADWSKLSIEERHPNIQYS